MSNPNAKQLLSAMRGEAARDVLARLDGGPKKLRLWHCYARTVLAESVKAEILAAALNGALTVEPAGVSWPADDGTVRMVELEG